MREAARANRIDFLQGWKQGEDTRREGCHLKARLLSHMEGKAEPCLCVSSLCLLKPSLHPHSLSGQDWVPGPGSPQPPVHPQQSHPASWFSPVLQTCL